MGVWAVEVPSDGDTLSSLCANAAPLLKKFRAQELANAMLGLAHVEHDPGAAFFDAAMRPRPTSCDRSRVKKPLTCRGRALALNRAPPSELIDGLLEQDACKTLGAWRLL